jgi:hypothetical protein
MERAGQRSRGTAIVARHAPLIQSLAKEVKSMSTAELTNRLDRPEMTLRTIEPAQHTAAKVAGFLYLFTMATSIFAYSLRGRLVVVGDAVQTARNIVTSERLFRIATVSDLIMEAGVVMLVWALYVVLKPINRNVALLAAFWRLAASFIVAVTTLNAFAALALLSGADYLRAVETQQLQVLVYTFLRVHGAGFNVGFVFLGLGSTVFSYLWFKSRYIPRALAALGIFGSLVLAIVTLSIMVFPSLAAVVGLVHMMPMGIYEVGLGLWLLVKGLRAPMVE